MPQIFSIEMPSDFQENYADFRFEAVRRSSFRNWPVSFIDPVSLAAAGFYYTGEADIVRCFECQLLATYESRLNSFATWPTYMTQTSEELAHAGFFYTGINDFTTCYNCGITIGNWRSEEDPWERHMISSPSCGHFLPARSCKVCTERQATITFLPCG
ncbi:putative inhibitor of apoptosis, partial [Bombus flavifrons]|uniref:putative inhibitor of apoptosis n=1 Tax=Bombus flavifrons TaxID=103934 RepID=UPI0037039262